VLLLLLLVLGIPRPTPEPERARWDILAILVPSVDVTIPTVRGRRPFTLEMTAADRARVRSEMEAFADRVRERTDGRLTIRTRVVTAKRPLTTLSGPGPFWISPADVRTLIDEPTSTYDSVICFVKIGEDRGRAVPTRHFGGALGGDAGLDGACFAAVTFRPKWLDGSGDVVLHEWLHHLDWALTEVAGFPEDAVPDPDDGRRGPTCCEDAPEGDAAFADHILSRHLTEDMIRAADARHGPAVEDGWLRGWRVDGRLAPGAWRTVTLPRNARSAAAALPDGTASVLVATETPVLVTLGDGDAVRITERTVLPAAADRVSVRHAQAGRISRFRIRALPASDR
jgi:hypothetical protein